MTAILQSSNLNKSFTQGLQGTQHILKDVNLHVSQGECVAVMGPSGSGKSTLLYSVSGMDRITSGNVSFEGNEISRLTEKKLAALRLHRMGFIFQHVHLLRNLSILDNILLTGYLAGKAPRAEIRNKAEELMRVCGIEAITDHAITQASGGQLQRAGICRALINSPRILFGDEPTGALNSKSSREIMDLLGEINRQGTTVMLVTHDIKVAARTDRVLFMLDGRIIDEKALGKYSPTESNSKEREESLGNWLVALGF